MRLGDDCPGVAVVPDVGKILVQPLGDLLVGLGPDGGIGRPAALLEQGLDDGVGVAGEVRGEVDGLEDLGRAPPQVVEVGVDGAELAPFEGLELPSQGVVDLVGLLRPGTAAPACPPR